MPDKVLKKHFVLSMLKMFMLLKIFVKKKQWQFFIIIWWI